MYVYIICTYIYIYMPKALICLPTHWQEKTVGWLVGGCAKCDDPLVARNRQEHCQSFLPWKATHALKLNNKHQSKVYPNWLVVYLPLWKIWKTVGMIVPNIWKSKKCSKPPTRLDFHNFLYLLVHTCSSNSSDLAVVPFSICSARLLSLHRFLIGFWVEFS